MAESEEDARKRIALAVFEYEDEKEDLLGDVFGALVQAACLKQSRAGSTSPERAATEAAHNELLKLETAPMPEPAPTDEELRVHREKCLDLVRSWKEAGTALVNAVLTPSEVEHCTTYCSDREYRRRGDSLMAKFHRRKDEVLAGFPSTEIREYTKDLTLMRLYTDVRRATGMFCLSPDDQEAYDLATTGLDKIPVEVARLRLSRRK